MPTTESRRQSQEGAGLYTPEAQIEIEAIAVVNGERTSAPARHFLNLRSQRRSVPAMARPPKTPQAVRRPTSGSCCEDAIDIITSDGDL